MAGIGDDIAEVLEELGSKVRVYKHDTGDTYTEYVDTEQKATRSSPFDSHFVTVCSFPYDSNANTGDLISFQNSSQQFYSHNLLVSLIRETFENEFITNEGILYKCNAQAQIQRRTEERDPDTLEMVRDWTTLYSGEYVFFTGTMSMMSFIDEDYGHNVSDSNLMYLSSDLDVKTDDRCLIRDISQDTSGEAYQVQLVEHHRLPGIKICKVIDDTRE